MGEKYPINANVLAADLFQYSVSPREQLRTELGETFWIEDTIVRMFVVDYVLAIKSSQNPSFEIVRDQFNREIDLFCASRTELAIFQGMIADRFAVYADACNRVKSRHESGKSSHYYVGKAIAQYESGEWTDKGDAVLSSIYNHQFWNQVADMSAFLDGYDVSNV